MLHLKKAGQRRLVYNAKNYKNNMLKKTIPLMSFISILFVSFLLSGSAKISGGGATLAVDSPLAAIRISYKFDSIAIADVLRKISIDYGVKINSSVEIKGRASGNFISAPLGEALAVIFKDTAYGYRLEKDAIVIENKRGGAFSVTGDRMGFKRVLIAPAFAHIGRVKQLVESMKSPEAFINCDEKSGVLVLDERPEIADMIISKVNEIDAADSGEPEVMNTLERTQTKLFVMKNVSLKDAYEPVVKMLSASGTAYPNYELNSLIVTDAAEPLNHINAFITRLENQNGVAVLNYKFYRVPRPVMEDLAGLGYYDPAKIEQAELAFSVIKNKNHFISILEKYLKNSAKLSCGTEENVEIKILRKSISTLVSVKPYIDIDSGYSVKIGLKEDAQAFNETIRFKSQNYSFELGENEMIIAKGFEKSFIDVINQTCVRGFLAYMPSLKNVNEELDRLAGSEAARENDDFIIMALDLSTVKSNSGMARYSFVNLLHLDSQTSYTGFDSDSFSANKSYLNIFAAPAGSENIFKSDAAAENNRKGIAGAEESLRAAFKSGGRQRGESNSKPSAKNGGDEGENLILEDHKKELALKLNVAKEEPDKKSASESEVLSSIKKFISRSEFEKAKSAAEKYLESAPGSVNVRIALGSVYKEMKLYVSSREELKKALRYDRTNEKLISNINKLDNLINLIKEERVKLAGKKEAAELDIYLR